jgi:CheY-like chemotaxis protein
MTKVLVVEDNPLNMELIIEILDRIGFIAHEAINGEEAVKKADAESYDLIIMDIELPIFDGVEAAKRIRKKHKNIHIIALTSYAMKGDRERFLAAGFDEYMSKPIEVADLIKRLETYRK